MISFPETALSLETVDDIQWASGDTGPPPNTPYCWFLNNNPACQDQTREKIHQNFQRNTFDFFEKTFHFLLCHVRSGESDWRRGRRNGGRWMSILPCIDRE